MKKTKHVIVIVTMAMMFLVEAGLAVRGVQSIETEYIENYLKQQEQYMTQINQHLNYMLEQGAGEQALVKYMSEIPVSGSYYAWLTKDETVIFAKNETVTESLGEARVLPVFQETIHDNETCSVSTEFSHDGKAYMTGMVIDKSYILNNKSLQKFKMYGAVSMSVMGLLVFSVLIVYVQGFWREKKRNIAIAKELRDKNSVLDEVYGDMKSLNHRIQVQEENPQQKSYDLQMAKKLLDKSDRIDIQPVHYAAIQLKMDEGQYYGKQMILDIMDKISLDKRHVRMELQKGSFLVMFYRTERAEMEEILKKAQKAWTDMDVMLEVHAGIITPGTSEREWLDEFLERKRKVV